MKSIIKYPENFSKDKKYPLIVYLHGAGSRGDDISLLETSPIMNYRNSCKDFSAIILSPQCYADSWFDIFEELINLIEESVYKRYVDKDKVYLTGVSMGGYASWQLLMSKPELFKRAVILCGGGMYWNAGRIKAEVKAFHGMLDEVVKVEESIKMVNAVNRNGGKATLTIFENLEHNCWERVYSDRKTYIFLLEGN